MLDIIAFDADDTLWHNELYYVQAQDRFKQVLAGYGVCELADQRLDATETSNVKVYGYGIKSFTLSMIETAIALTGGRITGQDIQTILELGKHMLDAEIHLFDQVQETLAMLAQHYPLMLITKGDLFEQERKIARSGLVEYLDYIEIMGEKTPTSYQGLLCKYNLEPERFMMVGNSLRSDIMPVLDIGGQAVYIPYQHTWAHENVADRPAGQQGYYELERLGQLPELIARLEG